MNEEILRLLFDYSKKGKIVDLNYINKLIEIVVNKRKLSSFIDEVNTLTVHEEKPSISASYNSINKKLSIYKLGMTEQIKLHGKKYIEMFNKVERLFFTNLIVTQIILHELEHVLQYKNTIISPSDKDINIKWVIIALSYGLNIRKDMKLYKTLYRDAPQERIAEIDSYLTLMETLNPVKFHLPNIQDYIMGKMYENLLRGYVYDSSPTIEFFNIIGGERKELFDCYLLCHNIEDLPFSERIYNGLDITDKEYGYVLKKYLKTKYSKI